MKIRNTVAAIVIILILAATAYGAQWLTLLGWNAVVQYPSPYARPLPFGPGGQAIAERVVLVVVDGLRVDRAEQLPVLNRLRAQGASVVSWTGEPSLSDPGWTAIVSGASPEVSGVTTNWYDGTVAVDTLFAAAKRADLTTAVAGSPGWAELFGPALDEQVLVGDPPGDAPAEALYRVTAEVADGAAGILQRGDARLVVVHVPSVDLAGHRFGGASDEYAAAARRADAHLGSLLLSVDLTRDTVIVTSDHGHLDRGGHGGWEPVVKRTPLVLAGRGIRAASDLADVRQIDIAPTIAVLLGISIPAHSQGRPLVEVLDADPAAFGPRWIEQQRFFYRGAAGVLGSEGPAKVAADPENSAALAAGGADFILGLSDDLARTYFLAREQRLADQRRQRLPAAAAAAAVPLIAVIWVLRRRLLGPALAGAAAFFVIDYALFFGRGGTFSLSIFNSEAQILAFFNQRLIDASVAAAVAGLIAGMLAARRAPADAFLGALGTAWLAAYVIVLQVVYFYWQWDVRFTWYLPDLRLGFKYYLDLLMLVPLGFLATLYGAVGLLGRWPVRLVLSARASRRAVSSEPARS